MKSVILAAFLALIGLVVVVWWRRSLGPSRGDEPGPLADRLSTGDAGIRWTVPGSWEVETSNAVLAVYSDEARHLLWYVSVSPFGLDVSEESFGLLGRDIEREARREFESSTPRTREKDWSPVVSVEAITVDGVRAVEAVYRRTYEPGDEIVVGQLIIPLAEGSASVKVMAKAALTGLRESVLLMKALEEKGDGSQDWPTLTQDEIDDPAFDDRGLGPLSSVREALRWLTAADGAGLSVTQPADAPSLEVSLAGPRCSIIPPPRYVRVSKDFPRAETMGVLSRVALGPEGVLVLDVYRVPDRRLKPGDRRGLEAFARANAQGWTAEGANDISSEIHSLETGDGRTHVGNRIQYSAHGVPFRTFAHWFIDHDGVLFRVGVCGPPHTPLKELAADASRAVETLRREDAPRSD